MWTIGHEGLELPTLAEQVDPVLVVEFPELVDRLGVERAAEPRLVETVGGDLQAAESTASVASRSPGSTSTSSIPILSAASRASCVSGTWYIYESSDGWTVSSRLTFSPSSRA